MGNAEVTMPSGDKSMNKERGRPVLIRHRFSGVWIGYIVGKGTFDYMIELEGRRIWSWSGDRLECSQLANQGVKERDKLGDWERVEISVGAGDGLIELRTINAPLVEEAKKL